MRILRCFIASTALVACSAEAPITPGGDGGSAGVGALGGEVSSGRLTLRIPAGAVATPTRITATPATAPLSPVPASAWIEGWDMAPDGLRFAVPASARWVSTEPSENPVVIVSQSGATLEYLDESESEVSPEGPRVTARVDHFSRLSALRLNFVALQAASVVSTLGAGFTAGFTLSVTGSAGATGTAGTPMGASVAIRPGSAPVATNLALATPVTVNAGPLMVTQMGSVTGVCTSVGATQMQIPVQLSPTLMQSKLPSLGAPRTPIRVMLSIPVQCMPSGGDAGIDVPAVMDAGGDVPVVFDARGDAPAVFDARGDAPAVMDLGVDAPVPTDTPMGSDGGVSDAPRADLVLADGPNQPPVASDDTAVTAIATAVSVPVAANDNDPDSFLDLNTVRIERAPMNGTATGGAGSARYTPNPGFMGVDTFTYSIADAQGLRSNHATVTVTVTSNVPPTTVADVAQIGKGRTATIDVLLNDRDADDGINPASVQLSGAATGGTVTVNPDGTLRWIAPTTQGTYTARYTVADAAGGRSMPATVTLTVINEVPTARDDVASTAVGAPVNVPVTTNDDDDSGAGALTVMLVDNPRNGTVTVQPGGFMRYTPSAGFTGVDSFVYRASDAAGAGANAVATVVVGAQVDINPADQIMLGDFMRVRRLPGGPFVGLGTGAAAAILSTIPGVHAGFQRLAGSAFYYRFEITQDFTGINPAAPITLSSSLQRVSHTTGVPTGLIAGRRGFADGADALTTSVDPMGMSFTLPPVISVTDASNNPLILGAPTGAFGLETRVTIPAGSRATEFFTFILTTEAGQTNGMGQFVRRGVMGLRPLSSMLPTGGTTARTAPIVDAAAMAWLVSEGGPSRSEPITLALYNHRDNTTFYPGARPNQLQTGFVTQLPASALAPSQDPCASAARFTLCERGTNPRVIVTNQNGSFTYHNRLDGSLLGNLRTSTAPNFLDNNTWQAAQGPDNCIWVSDETNGIRRYRPNNGEAIDLLVPRAGVRGIAIHDNQLYAATNDAVLRYDINPAAANGRAVGPVLTNMVELIREPGMGFNGILVQPNRLLVSLNGSGSGAGEVRSYTLQGATPRTLTGTLGTPYQIIELIDGRMAVANFGARELRVFSDTAPDLEDLVFPMTDSNPRGLAQLYNGDVLLGGRTNLGISTLDLYPTGSVGMPVRVQAGNTVRMAGAVCLSR